MDESEAKDLIERGLSGSRARPEFREQLLSDSCEALLRSVRTRARWRKAGLAAAAVLIGAVSFLSGRLSAPGRSATKADPAPQVAAETEAIQVPDDLVAWLDAANLFRQLGMEERMARAVERAGKLRPHGAGIVENADGSASATGGNPVVAEREAPVALAVLPRLYESCGNINGIMAHSLGGNRHASERD
jgi:hypothetical protein